MGELHHAVIVQDREHRRAQADDRPARRAAQCEVHRLVAVHNRFIDDWNCEGFGGGVPVGPAERPIDRRVTDVRSGTAAGGGVVDRHRTEQAVGADDGDGSHTAGHVFVYRVTVRAEVQRAGGELVINDRQHRRRLRAEPRRRAAYPVRVREREHHRPVAIRDGVVNDRHQEGLRHHAVPEDQRAADVGIFGRDSGGRRRAVARGEVHGDDAVGAEGADDGDDGVVAILVHAEGRRLEDQQTVVVRDGHRGRCLRAERGPARGSAQCQDHRLVALGRDIVNVRDREGLAIDPGAEGQRVRHAHIVHPVHRRAVGGVGQHANRVRQAPEAAHRDRGIRGLTEREVRSRELQAARVGRVPAVEARDAAVRLAVHRREGAADHDPVIVELHQRRRHVVVRAGAEVDRQIARTGGEQARDAAARQTVHRAETATDEQLPVRLRHNGVDVAVRRRRERVVHDTSKAQAGQVRVRLIVHRVEQAANDEVRLTARDLHRERVNRAVHAHAQCRRERRVHRAVGGEPRHANAEHTVHGEEIPDDDHAAVTRQGDRTHEAVGGGIEAHV